MLQAKVCGRFAALCVLDTDVNTLANNLKEGLLSTADGLLGRQRKKIQAWLTNERRQLKQQKYTSRTRVYESEQRSQEEGKKAAKEEWIEEQRKNIEKRMTTQTRG